MALLRREPNPTAPPPIPLLAQAQARAREAEAVHARAHTAFHEALNAERMAEREAKATASRRDSALSAELALAAVREFEELNRKHSDARAVRQALERALDQPRAAAHAAASEVDRLRAEAARSEQLAARQRQVVAAQRREVEERERAAQIVRDRLAEAEAQLGAIVSRRAAILGPAAEG